MKSGDTLILLVSCISVKTWSGCNLQIASGLHSWRQFCSMTLALHHLAIFLNTICVSVPVGTMRPYQISFWLVGMLQRTALTSCLEGRSPEFRDIMAKHGIDIDLVREILKSKHAMSALLFGSMDLDNLDNVMRMAWALGMEADPRLAVNLARSLDVDADGQLLLHQEMFPLVAEWARARQSVYETLVFDPYTVAAQAVLSQATQCSTSARCLRSGLVGLVR